MSAGIKYCITALCLLLAVLGRGKGAYAVVPDPEEIGAEAAVLMDADTGQVLYEKNGREQRQPASITKILTGLLAVERLSLAAVLTAGDAAVDIPSWGSTAYIQAGEQLTVDQVMYAMMLRSANEAANILAEETAGSLSDFAKMMNERAAELGAQNTHFTNANGLPDSRHVTTAYDMALITRQAMGTPGFLPYFGAAEQSIPATNQSGPRAFVNTHRMLLKNDGAYHGSVIGGKTGYTVPAGHTLVTAARSAGRTLICVVLKSDHCYADTRALLEYGFEQFLPHTYVLPELPPAELSIREGDREAGRAYLYRPASVRLLLHESVDPADIVAEDQLPGSPAPGDEIAGSVALRLAGAVAPGLPDTLAILPMDVEVAIFAQQPVQPGLTSLPRRDREASATPLAVGAMALSGATGLIMGPRSARRRQRRSACLGNRGGAAAAHRTANTV